MKKFFPLVAAGIMALALVTNADAARRFGGGASFGRPAPAQMAPAGTAQRPRSTPQPQAAPPQQRPAPAAAPTPAAQPKPASPIRNMLMGAAAALGIAALTHYLGLGPGFASILMLILIAVVAFAVLRFILARRQTPVQRSADSTGTLSGMNYQREEPPAAAPAPAAEPAPAAAPAAFQSNARPGSVLDEFSQKAAQSTIPAGFDETAFVAECKKNFTRLQDAWSTGNVLQLSEFCTDEVFTVLTHQLRDRKGEELKIAVETLDAKLLGVITEGSEYVAAVHFTGRLKVSGGNTDEIENVNEVWSLTRPVENGNQGWLLAGIQQVEA